MPSSAIEIRIADALASSMRAATFSGPLTCRSAARRFVPETEPLTAGVLQVSVVPGQVEVTNVSRGADLFDVEIHVVMSKRFNDDAEIDDLIELRTEIVDAIRSAKLPAATPAMPDGVQWLAISNITTFDRDAMAGGRVFLADVAVQYRISQGKLP
jgi:hypothetical protein